MIDKIWYKRTPTLLSFFLKPFSFIFIKIANSRKVRQQKNSYKTNVPVIIVGNISVGGTGKTPVVRRLAQEYLSEAKRPIIISRGYGAKAEKYPFVVSADTPASTCGDEPAMLYDALAGRVPIIISPQRVDSVKFIEREYPDTDVIICDDGLQHYKLARDYEIVVVDASRMFGNGLCLPAGPLREPIERLKTVNSIIAIGNCDSQDKNFLKTYNSDVVFTKIIASEFVNVLTKERVAIKDFIAKNIVAVAGIGNPNKFFTTLENIEVFVKETKVFKDHHKFVAGDFADIDGSETIVMTYKDAIKCRSFANENWWYLDIDLDVSQFDFKLKKVV